MRTDWFIVDSRTGAIVNCVNTAGGRERAEASLAGFIDAEHLTVTDRPTPAQLAGYRYWNERP